MSSAYLSGAQQRAMEQGWDLDRRAWRVLDLIAAEFYSDPMSVQCFDRRTVEEAMAIVRDAKILDPQLPEYSRRFSR